MGIEPPAQQPGCDVWNLLSGSSVVQVVPLAVAALDQKAALRRLLSPACEPVADQARMRGQSYGRAQYPAAIRA